MSETRAEAVRTDAVAAVDELAAADDVLEGEVLPGPTADELAFDVDDLPGNLRPARALGMATVLHRGDAEATLAEVGALLT